MAIPNQRPKIILMTFFCLFILAVGCQPALPVVPSPVATGTVKSSTGSRTPASRPTGTPMPNQNTTVPFDPAKAGTVERDVTYCNARGVALKMNVYYPDKPSNSPWPVVVFVHGGGWTSGDKETTDGLHDIPEFVRRGYLVASLNYRLAPQYQFPAQIEDCKCAVRYLRAHARNYNLEPAKIGAAGPSAGGHLVALLGLTDDQMWLDPDIGYADQSSSVQAVVDLYGPTDMTQVFPGASDWIDEKVFGAGTKRDRRLIAASPVHYVSAGAPPFLLMHGAKDDLVPLSQAQALYERLKEVRVPVKLVVVKNAGHVFTPVDGKAIEPTRERLTQMMADFFDDVLR